MIKEEFSIKAKQDKPVTTNLRPPGKMFLEKLHKFGNTIYGFFLSFKGVRHFIYIVRVPF